MDLIHTFLCVLLDLDLTPNLRPSARTTLCCAGEARLEPTGSRTGGYGGARERYRSRTPLARVLFDFSSRALKSRRGSKLFESGERKA